MRLLDKMEKAAGFNSCRNDFDFIQDDVIEVISDYTMSKHIGSLLQALPLVLTDKMVYKELFRLIKSSNKVFSGW